MISLVLHEVIQMCVSFCGICDGCVSELFSRRQDGRRAHVYYTTLHSGTWIRRSGGYDWLFNST